MAGNTDRFFELIEGTFNVDEITSEKIMDKFYTGTFTKIKAGKDNKGKQRRSDSEATMSGHTTFLELSERLARGGEIVRGAESVADLDELKEIQRKDFKLEIHSNDVKNRIDRFIVQAEEVKKQEQAIAENQAREFIVDEYQKAETVEDERKIRAELKRELPNSLRSIKGWQTRRGKEAFRFVFEES